MSLNLCLKGKKIGGCLWLVLAILTAEVFAQPTVTTFLFNGVAAPDGNGQVTSANAPALNDAGQLSFVGNVTGTSGGAADNIGIFRLAGTNLDQIVRGQDSIPNSADSFSASFSNPPPINAQGLVAFQGLESGSLTEAGVYTGSGGSLGVVADNSDSPPDGNGTFAAYNGLAINSVSQVAFVGDLVGTTPANVNRGIYRGDGSSLIEIARLQDIAPDGNGVFTDLRTPAINAFGQVAFAANLSAANATSGVFRGDGSTLTQIARDGNPAPALGGGTNGLFNVLGNDVALNELGEVAFTSTLSNTSGGSSDNVGVFRGDSELTNVMIAREGQVPSEGNGNFSSFGPPAINSFGTVAFRATLSGTIGAGVDNHGIYVGDGLGITTVLRDGTPAHNGIGTFELSSSLPVINDAGQVGFKAVFRGAPASANEGLYFWDPSAGLLKVARKGDAFLGSTITELRWAERGGSGDLQHSGLNGAAQMAFGFRLANNTEGVAIWSANLTIIPTGDYDGDGDVDGRDFLLWQRGQSPNNLSPVDLSVWQIRYGSSFPFTSDGDIAGLKLSDSLKSVPEPHTAVFLAMLGVLIGLQRKASRVC